MGKRHKFVRPGIFSLPVVLWLMIFQRLQGSVTLSGAVERLRQGGCDRLLTRCKRVRQHSISARTGCYCAARQKLSILAVKPVIDDLFEVLMQRMRQLYLGDLPEVYLMDSTSIQLSHHPELNRLYPPGRNQHGDNHWPLMKLVVFHGARTPWLGHCGAGEVYGEGAGLEPAQGFSLAGWSNTGVSLARKE